MSLIFECNDDVSDDEEDKHDQPIKEVLAELKRVGRAQLFQALVSHTVPGGVVDGNNDEGDDDGVGDDYDEEDGIAVGTSVFQDATWGTCPRYSIAPFLSSR